MPRPGAACLSGFYTGTIPVPLRPYWLEVENLPEERMRRVAFPVFMVIITALLTLGCSSPAAEQAAGSELPAITCEVAFRPGVDQPVEESRQITLKPGDNETVSWDEAMLDISYNVYPSEDTTIIIDARVPGNEEPVHRSLYQIAGANVLSTNFAGGHGFTGLHYFYPPGGTTEVQYYCSRAAS